jgi:ferredoxin-type protein NapH
MKAYQIRHLGIQVVRRFVQLAVVGLLALLAFLSLYAHYRAARALEDQIQSGTTRGKVFAAVDQCIARSDNPQKLLDGYKGTLWSMRLAGVELTDPLAAAETIATTKKLYLPLLATIVIPVVVTLLLGKVFCSWICPAGLLLEITGKLRKVLGFVEIPPAEVKFSHANKYVLLGVGLVVAGIVGLPMFALIYPPAVLSRLAHAWIFGTSMTGMLVLMSLIVGFELFVSPRWWCRTVCPGGALYGLIGWSRLLRVKLDSERCTGCRECEPVCEPGLNPVLQSSGIECDNCGVCIRHCPDQALLYTIALPKIGRRRHESARFKNMPKLPVATTLLMLLAMPLPAWGHHILGLPHYSYKENYPQAPTLEYPATTGPYDVLMTSYPGRPVPGEAATIAFYIKDRNTNRPYDRPVTIRVLRTATFGANTIIHPPATHQPFDNQHRFTINFPEEAEFVVELTMEVEGQQEVIPFLMVVGNPTATVSVVVAIAFGLACFLIVVRAIKIKQQKRRAANPTATANIRPQIAGTRAVPTSNITQ